MHGTCVYAAQAVGRMMPPAGASSEAMSHLCQPWNFVAPSHAAWWSAAARLAKEYNYNVKDEVL